ncbi:MAG: hypothetical protein VX766_12830, partial [Pseudomonadota bacterium]|nr:hypothetical protein [Pseudomonadota bacterium]
LFGGFTFLRRALEACEVSGMLVQLTFKNPNNIQDQPQSTDGASREPNRADRTGEREGRHYIICCPDKRGGGKERQRGDAHGKQQRAGQNRKKADQNGPRVVANHKHAGP